MLPDYEITAASSRRQETADAIAKESGFAHSFNNARTLIHHSEVGLVAVLPLAPQHSRWAVAAFDVEFFCDKT
jgi:predicted dehydrogenase